MGKIWLGASEPASPEKFVSKQGDGTLYGFAFNPIHMHGTSSDTLRVAEDPFSYIQGRLILNHSIRAIERVLKVPPAFDLRTEPSRQVSKRGRKLNMYGFFAQAIPAGRKWLKSSGNSLGKENGLRRPQALTRPDMFTL